MLKPKTDVKKFEEYGFKPCKGTTKESQCYYLCVSRGCKMLLDIIYDLIKADMLESVLP